MARNYAKYTYFRTRPDVVRLFEDLEALQDFCRFELLPFNPADLYNRHSKIWQYYVAKERPPRRPYLGRNPRSTKNP